MATCRFRLQPVKSHRKVSWKSLMNTLLYKHTDSLEKVMTVKCVAQVFIDFVAQLGNKRHCSLIHMPMLTD